MRLSKGLRPELHLPLPVRWLMTDKDCNKITSGKISAFNRNDARYFWMPWRAFTYYGEDSMSNVTGRASRGFLVYANESKVEFDLTFGRREAIEATIFAGDTIGFHCLSFNPGEWQSERAGVDIRDQLKKIKIDIPEEIQWTFRESPIL